MPVYRLTIELTQDGQRLPGFPLTRSKDVPDTAGLQEFVRASSAGFNEIQFPELGDLNIFVYTADQVTTLRFNDQTDAGIPLNANSLVVLFDSNILSTATTKVSMENNSGSNATITTLGGGT